MKSVQFINGNGPMLVSKSDKCIWCREVVLPVGGEPGEGCPGERSTLSATIPKVEQYFRLYTFIYLFNENTFDYKLFNLFSHIDD